jgi:hypothetical protein
VVYTQTQSVVCHLAPGQRGGYGWRCIRVWDIRPSELSISARAYQLEQGLVRYEQRVKVEAIMPLQAVNQVRVPTKDNGIIPWYIEYVKYHTPVLIQDQFGAADSMPRSCYRARIAPTVQKKHQVRGPLKTKAALVSSAPGLPRPIPRAKTFQGRTCQA